MVKALLLLFLSMTSIYTARAYDFSASASSGQVLYYNILSDSTVAVTYPNHVLSSYYSGFQKPTGSLAIPASVSYGGTTYQVVSVGDNAFNSCAGLTVVTIPNTVTTIGSSACSQCTGLTSLTIGNSVTSIGDNAFMGCTSLASLNIPNSVTMIGVGSFQGCSSLQTITLGSSVSTIGNVAFEGCSSVTSLSIPNSVTLIGNWAFCNLTSLDSLYIGSSVTYFLQNTFAGTDNVRYLHYNAKNANVSYFTILGYQSALPVGSITQLVVGDSVQSIQQYAFSGAIHLDSVTLGFSLTSVSSSAFHDCANVHYLNYNAGRFTDNTFPSAALNVFSRLTQVVVGDSVLRIPARAFIQKDSLYTITMANSVNAIGDSCFYGCGTLSTVQLSNTLSSIGASAFQGCSNLSGTLTLPNTMVSIGSNAFRGCTSLSGTLNIPSSVTTIGQAAFYGCTYLVALNTFNAQAAIPADAFYNCERLYQVNLGDHTPSIGPNAFRNCLRLANVSLGTSLTTIGQRAFQGCVRLTTPTFPNSLTTLGDSAFYGCSLLGGHLTFPSAVTSIGNHSFANTAAITAITVKAVTPPTIYANTFASAPSTIPVFVPCGSLLSYYVSSHWDDFVNLAEAAPFDLNVSANDTLMGNVTILQQPTCSNHTARIQASANAGYHFIRWNDGNTANPRQITLSSDTSFMAVFVSDYSYVTVLSNDTAAGSVTGSGLYSYNDSVILTATANAGYHFQYWNDGNTANPRLLFASQDTTFTAIFLSNNSTITVINNNPTMGSVSGGGTYYYQNQAVITATPFYGYHFTAWHDGITANPRTVLVSQDSTFSANFAVNIYNISVASNNNTMGGVLGNGSYNYLSSATVSATANFGYHFVQWTDGVTDNPRTFVVLSDSSFVAQFAPNNYSVAVSANDTAMGTVYGNGVYSYNSIASISAVPSFGYHFVQWNDGDTSNPRLVTVLGNASYTAQFAINSYAVSVTSANPLMGTASGGGSFVHGANTYITATASYGYHFTQWNDGNTDNPRLISVTQNASYVAQFAINSYSVSVSSNNNALGSVTGGGIYVYNSQATLTATPLHGFYFAQWSDGNTDNPRILTVTSDVNLIAQFDSINYTLYTSSTNYAAGNVVGGGSYAYLSQVTITAMPMPHYHFVQWTDSVTTNPRLVTLTSDTLFTAQFALDTHAVLALSADSVMGQVFGSGTWAYGTATYLTALPNYGYHFTQWSDGNLQNPRRVIVSSDTVFSALFDYNVYTLSVPSNDTSLGVTSGAGSYNYLSSVTIEATPVGNSRFLGWSDGVLDNPRTIVITCDTMLAAHFASNYCNISCLSNDTNLGVVNGAGIYDYLSQALLEAVPDSHCHFVAWSDGVTTNPRLVTVLYDSTFTAIFESDGKYYITVNSNNDSLGSVSGQGYYFYGDQATLQAIPAERARFLYWSDGSTQNPRTVQVLSDFEYTAIFAPETYQVSLIANYPAIGALYGAGEYPYGEEVVITAVAFPGAEFLGWSDSITDNPRTIVVTSDTLFYALFRDLVGIDDVQGESCVITTGNKTIHVQGAANRAVTVFDLIGRPVAFEAQAGESISIPVSSAGVYLVQVEGLKARKVVVR